MHAGCLIVFGALRSGTTMLRLMLDAHPQLACTGEHDFLFDYLRRTDGSWTYDREGLGRDRIFAGSRLRIPGELDGLDALNDLISQIGRNGGGLPVLMVHRNLEKLLSILSEARVIHFVRDPRDVARSSIGMMWAGNVFYGIDNWLHTEGEWERAGTALGDRVVEIRYEDLVRTPRATLEEICTHAGIPYDDRMLSYPETSTYSAPDASLAFQWRKTLSDREVQLVEYKAGQLLAERGYQPSPLPPIRLSPLDRAGLWLQNKSSIWSRMVRVYGVIPMMERSIGRRLRMRSLQTRGQSKMDVITRRRVK